MQKRCLLVLFLVAGLLRAIEASDPSLFVQISPVAAVANLKLAKELRPFIWDSAEDVWVPDKQQATSGLNLINSSLGRDQIIANAPPKTDMLPCLVRLPQSRFQIFGLIIKGHKCILYDIIPFSIPPERANPKLWLQRSLTLGIPHGTAWSILFDYESGRVVASSCPPREH